MRASERVTRSVALLRGINVGGNSKVPMSVLRDLFAQAGCTDVTTLINSGNVVFSGEVTATDIEKRVKDATAVSTRVVILSAKRLAAILEAVPFEGDESKLGIWFMNTVPTGVVIPEGLEPELIQIGPDAVYEWLPDGFAGTKLKPSFWKQFPPETTARNVRTVKKLLALI
jgi:uncharacterized protein (DUF1697 family)